MGKNNRTGKRLRLPPLILGSYGAFLGFGLIAIGLTEIKEGIGIIRLLMGIAMAGFGLLGIWDGVRDLVKPDKKPKQTVTNQFILTDTSGNKTSLVTLEVLQEQIGILAESEDPKQFAIQILSPLSTEEHGMLKQILCRHRNIILTAFFEMPKDGYRIYEKSTDPDMAVEWLKQLLAGTPDFSGWENWETKVPQDEGTASTNKDDTGLYEADICPDGTDIPQESLQPFWHQLLADQKEQIAYWHQLLVIWGENWHNEHKFFSARDIELTMEGIHRGKYQKAVLEWGTQSVNLFPGVSNDLMVIWCTNNTGKGDTRFLAKEGTVTQVNFWLTGYLDHGFFEGVSGWTDVTSQIESITPQMEKEMRKDKKKHGKIF